MALEGEVKSASFSAKDDACMQRVKALLLKRGCWLSASMLPPLLNLSHLNINRLVLHETDAHCTKVLLVRPTHITSRQLVSLLVFNAHHIYYSWYTVALLRTDEDKDIIIFNQPCFGKAFPCIVSFYVRSTSQAHRSNMKQSKVTTYSLGRVKIKIKRKPYCT